MQQVKINSTEATIVIPKEVYERAGNDIFAHIAPQKTPVTITLPSLRDEIKMRFWFKIFLLSLEKTAESNIIIVKAHGKEMINGQSEIAFNSNGTGVMIIPVGNDDWMCFLPAMPKASTDETNGEQAEQPSNEESAPADKRATGKSKEVAGK